MTLNRMAAGHDDELAAELRNPPPCEVPVGLRECLLAAIPARLEKGSQTIYSGPPSGRSGNRLLTLTRPEWRHRKAVLFATAACVPAMVATTALMLFQSVQPAPSGLGATGPSASRAALNSHAEETRPCDVLPPLP
jgi:hypothetical protein